MKILIVSTVRYRRNGISSVIENLFCSQPFENEDISFLFPTDNDPAMVRKLEDRGFHVYTKSRKDVWNYFHFLKKLIKENQFDLVHAHGNSSTLLVEMLAAKQAGCKVRIAHSHNTTCKSMTMHKLLNPLFQSYCTHRLACGTEAGKWLYGERLFQVVNNGIDTARFAFRPDARQVLREHYGIREADRVIGHVGIFNDQKNQEFLVKTLDALNRVDENFRLLLIGEGPLREKVEEKTIELGLSERVIFAGVTDQIPEHLSAMDLIVMPSMHEGLPLSLIEEQANGLRCVVSDSITREVDKTENLVFLPLEAGADHWAQVIRQMPAENNREEMSHNAIEKIKACGYDIHSEAEKLKNDYVCAMEKMAEEK